MPYINVDEVYILDNTGVQVDQVVDSPYTSPGFTGSQKDQFRKSITAGTVVVTFSSFSSLPQTATNDKITATQVVLNSVLSNPAAQTDDWTVTTAAGSVTVSGTINGSTTLTLYLAEPV